MTDEFSAIAQRRAEVAREIERLRNRLASLEAELVDLDTAERVIARLLGTKKERPSPPSEGTPRAVQSGSMTEKILLVMSTKDLWEPKDVTAAIQSDLGEEADSTYISSAMWRLWKRGRLAKEGAFYRLPQTNEAPQGGSPESASEPEET